MHRFSRLIILFLLILLCSSPGFCDTLNNSGIGFRFKSNSMFLDQGKTGGTITSQDTETAGSDTVAVLSGFELSKSPTGALFRSLLVPGWGQLYTGHWFKALIYFGTDVGMIYGIFVQHDRYLENKDLASRQKLVANKEVYQRSADFYEDDRNRLIWWTVGVTLLAGFDAYVEAYLYDFKIDPELAPTPSGDGVQMGLTITFPRGKR